MQQRETSHMKTLAEEWKRRDKERELMVKKKVTTHSCSCAFRLKCTEWNEFVRNCFFLPKLEEYTRLEEKLKRSIADLERREKQLSASETQVGKIMFWFCFPFYS